MTLPPAPDARSAPAGRSAPGDLSAPTDLAAPADRPTAADRSRRPDHHPAVAEHLARRAEHAQVRLADGITRFAGSMAFVYAHVLVFAVWMLVLERSPWPTLTLVVSLEAIFLSTFVMIGQNRQAAFQQAKADHDFVAQELELQSNTEITRAIHALTVAIHAQVVRAADTDAVSSPVPAPADAAGSGPAPDASAGGMPAR